MSAPKVRIRPATPRKDAAERYSPPIAEALSAGRTVREATKKSQVVRENRSPQMPIAERQQARPGRPRRCLGARGSSAPDQVGEVALVALRSADVDPAEQHQQRVDQEARAAPRSAASRGRCGVSSSGASVEERAAAADRQPHRGQDADGEPQLRAQQRAHVDLAQLGLRVDLLHRSCGRRRTSAAGPVTRTRGGGGCSAVPVTTSPAGCAAPAGRAARACGGGSPPAPGPPTTTVQRPASVRISSTWGSATSSERWIRTKPASRHSLLQRGERGAQQVAALGGVQPGVVALRLDVA